MRRYSVGAAGQTVNLLSSDSGGSTPSRRTILGELVIMVARCVCIAEVTVRFCYSPHFVIIIKNAEKC